MWELDHKEGWAWKNWCFWIVVLQKILESPLDYREIKTLSILKEIKSECSLEGLMLTLKLQCFVMWRAYSLEKTLMLDKTESQIRSGQQRMRWLDSITDSVGVNLSKLWETGKPPWRTGKPGMLESMGSQMVRCDLAIEWKQPASWLQIPTFNSLLQRETSGQPLSPAPVLSSHCPVVTTWIASPHLKISLQTSTYMSRISTLSESRPSPILSLFTILIFVQHKFFH